MFPSRSAHSIVGNVDVSPYDMAKVINLIRLMDNMCSFSHGECAGKS